MELQEKILSNIEKKDLSYSNCTLNYNVYDFTDNKDTDVSSTHVLSSPRCWYIVDIQGSVEYLSTMRHGG